MTDCLTAADKLQMLSPVELQERIVDLKLLLDADEEYIKTLEQRNQSLWDANQKLEEQLRKSGIPFQQFNKYY
jgi:hypothetical protein